MKKRFLFVVSNPENAHKIEKFRGVWHIDKGGFKTKSAVFNWGDKSIKNPPIPLTEVILYKTTQDYKFSGEIIRRLKPTPRIERTPMKATKTKLFNANFDQAVNELAVEIGIDNNWLDLFKNYLLFGKKVIDSGFDIGISFSVVSSAFQKDKRAEEKLILTLTPNTKRVDILRLWKIFIEKWRKDAPGFIDIPRNWKTHWPE